MSVHANKAYRCMRMLLERAPFDPGNGLHMQSCAQTWIMLCCRDEPQTILAEGWAFDIASVVTFFICLLTLQWAHNQSKSRHRSMPHEAGRLPCKFKLENEWEGSGFYGEDQRSRTSNACQYNCDNCILQSGTSNINICIKWSLWFKDYGFCCKAFL